MLTQTVICLGLLITVDYFHAIDCISKDFMLKAFEKFEFGEDFIRRVSVLMRFKKLLIIVDGFLMFLRLILEFDTDVLFLLQPSSFQMNC